MPAAHLAPAIRLAAGPLALSRRVSRRSGRAATTAFPSWPSSTSASLSPLCRLRTALELRESPPMLSRARQRTNARCRARRRELGSCGAHSDERPGTRSSGRPGSCSRRQVPTAKRAWYDELHYDTAREMRESRIKGRERVRSLLEEALLEERLHDLAAADGEHTASRARKRARIRTVRERRERATRGRT